MVTQSPIVKQSFTLANMLAAMCSLAVVFSICIAMQNQFGARCLCSGIAAAFFFSLAWGFVWSNRPVVFAVVVLVISIAMLLTLVGIVEATIWLINFSQSH
jgi:hypothetical protein